MEIRVGCCGFPCAQDKYFKSFKVVEIQKTFYSLPRLEIVKKWREKAPGDFEFTIKAPQLITHLATSPTYRKLKLKMKNEKLENYGFFKQTEEVYSAWEELTRIAQILESKIILFQSPASFQPTHENKKNMREFLKKIRREDLVLVWEPRGEWKDNQIRGLCAELNLIHCVDPFSRDPVFGGLNYFRLHGKGGYRYRYSKAELRELLKKCIKPLNYVMFNNLYMFDNALEFLKDTRR